MLMNMAFKGILLQQKTRNDDIAAFEVLFRKYYEDLVKYSYSFTKDIDAAEEIVQDFFYNFWKNRKEIDIKLSIKAYLFRSVRNNSLKYLDFIDVRRKYAERVLSMNKDESGFDNNDLEYSELKEIVEDSLNELPERCSLIFRMSRFDGLKYEEIAKELSVSVKTVEANMTKALKHLRKQLGNYNGSRV